MERFMEAGRTDMTDEQFIRAYEMYKNTVYAVIYHYVQNDADAADLQQEVFMKLYTCEKSFESEEHRKAWLLRVAVNQSKNHLRSAGRIVCTELDETIPAPVREDHGDVLRAVLALPEKYRIPIHLFYYEEYSVKEIAQILGMMEATVKTRLNRGRSILKKQLGKKV